MREMLEGGPLDVLTGDYLAELTMLILGRRPMKDPSLGYARTFLRQLEDCLGLALERGVRIVVNAGGLNPAGLADAVREVAERLGLARRIASRRGRRPARRWGARPGALTADPTWAASASPPRCQPARRRRHRPGHRRRAGRRPGRRHHGWARSDYDALAGAVVAGHVLECGTQATGGNFSLRRGPRPRPRRVSRSPRSPPTAPASSPSTRAPAARSPSTR